MTFLKGRRKMRLAVIVWVSVTIGLFLIEEGFSGFVGAIVAIGLSVDSLVASARGEVVTFLIGLTPSALFGTFIVCLSLIFFCFSARNHNEVSFPVAFIFVYVPSVCLMAFCFIRLVKWVWEL